MVPYYLTTKADYDRSILPCDNEMEKLITEMTSTFRKNVFLEKKTFYFELENDVVTATVDAHSIQFEKGKTVADPDCNCKTSSEMLRMIWFNGYQPGILDFLGGKIKTNDPLMLQLFLQAFGK